MAPLTARPRLRVVAGIVALAILSLGGNAAAEPTDISVKAAFLPRFVRYVTWPPAAMPTGSDPFRLCVIGSDPFGPLLDQAAASQLIDGRHIVVRRMNSTTTAGNCQIAFVSSNRVDELSEFGARPVLTVTDGSSPGPRGIIHFVVVGGRVRFFIDQALAERRKLNISSRLLALALGVHQ